MRELILFDAQGLLPAAWAGAAEAGPVRVFNPALLRDGDRWIFAYRVVGPDGRRRIGICRLDSALKVVPGSPAPLSDAIAANGSGAMPAPALARNWYADPRLYRLGGRLFIYWNSGWHEPLNYQFLQELDAGSLRPKGQPRELTLAGPRRPLEKNWMIFGEGPFYAVYSARPHRVLAVPLEGEGAIACAEVASTMWEASDYERVYGELRGGAPPQRAGAEYFSICHSVHGVPESYRYAAAVYRFSGAVPFAPTGAPAEIFKLPNPFGGKRAYEKLNPAVGEVIYPCGAVYEGNRWFVSYGINDEHCAIASIAHADIEAAARG